MSQEIDVLQVSSVADAVLSVSSSSGFGTAENKRLRIKKGTSGCTDPQLLDQNSNDWRSVFYFSARCIFSNWRI